MQVSIQLKTEHVTSAFLPSAKPIAFVLCDNAPEVSEAAINQFQFELLKDDLKKLPHKVSFDMGEFESRNGADW